MDPPATGGLFVVPAYTGGMAPSEKSLPALLEEVRACRACEAELPLGPRPVLRAATTARVLIVGQAPGTRVHDTGIPWNDPSGERLRRWLDVDRDTFYDETRIAIIPMGLCYPGRGKSGDLPPRRECAGLWFDQLLAHLPHLELTVLAGWYAQRYYLGDAVGKTLTQTVENWRAYFPRYVPTPHPSPRNTHWLQQRPWFEAELVPALRTEVHRILG